MIPTLIRILAAFGIALAAGALSALVVRTHKQLCAFISLGAGLLGGGYKRTQMLWLVAAVESTTILGGLAGWYVFRNVSFFWLALALSNAAGGFFYLALHAVLGEILKHHKALVLANFAAGFVAVAALILYFHLRA